MDGSNGNSPWDDREPGPGLVGNLPGIAYRPANDEAGTLRFLRGRGCRELLGRDASELLAGRTSFFLGFIHPERRTVAGGG